MEPASLPLPDPDQSWIKVHTQIGVGVMMYDQDGALVQVSDRALHLLALDPVVGVHRRRADFMDLLYDQALDAAQVPAHVQFILDRSGENENIFTEFIRAPNGQVLCVHIVPLDEGRDVVLVFDLTQVVNTAATPDITWQNKIMLQAIEQGQTGMILFDPRVEGQPIIFVNRAACDMVGRERADLLGQGWQDVLPEVPAMDTYRVVHRHAESLQVLGVQVTMEEDLGIIVMADITPLHEKEEQLRHMQKLDSLGQLAGGVAHDFNNILGIIRGYAHVLKGRLAANDQVAQPIEHILSACARGAALSDKLLAFGRKKTAGAAQTPVGVGLLQMAGMIKPLLPPNIQLKVTGKVPPDIAVSCSEDHFAQIFMNLLINARDAMVDGGHIVIRADLVATDRVEIQVQDTGTGMSPEVQARIFEPYFTTKEVGKGTGLGLAMVYGLMQQNSGEIWVESRLRMGTTFTLRFPAVRAAPKKKSARVKASDKGVPSFTDVTALVVDDEEGLRESLSLVLAAQGVKVLMAGDGDAALAVQDEYEGPIDVLLSDVRMPNMNGEKLAQLWRAVRPDCKIIMMSGYPDVDMVPDLYDAFLVKPVDFDALLRLVADVLGQGVGEVDESTLRRWRGEDGEREN